MKCTVIDIEALRRDRDQLWAEALHAYRNGARHWLDTQELVEAAAVEQADRYQGDAWTDNISTYLLNLDTTSIGEIMKNVLDKPVGQWQHNDEIRISKILTVFGWERYKAREGNQRPYRYRRAPLQT